MLQRRLSVGIVDSFKGQERDIRRMNVGITRARPKLLLVGDSSTLCRHPFFVELLACHGGGGLSQSQLVSVLTGLGC